MSDFIGTVTNAGLAKIADAIGGTALNLATVRVGDGSGAPITPNPTMTDLVRRVGNAYPIVSAGRDPVNANHWRISALIPVEDGPFDIREIGVWDAAGTMIAVARHVLVEKRTPAQGAAVELLTDIVFPVSETAQVTVQVQPASQISILQMLRAGFTVVDSATVTAPPGTPALGRTHVVPADATGAWAGLAGYLVQWGGSVWSAVDVPAGFVVVAADKAVDANDRYLRRSPAGWVSAAASASAYGVTRLATPAEALARTNGNIAVSPTSLVGLIGAGLDFRTVISALVTAPPVAPTLGDAYLIPAGATGAWAGAIGAIATFNGDGWSIEVLRLGARIVDRSRSIGDELRELRQAELGVWTAVKASAADWGLARLASPAQIAAGAAADVVVSAAGLHSLAKSHSQNGYQTLPGGLVMQWGLADPVTGVAITSVTFPIAFTAPPYSIVLTDLAGSVNNVDQLGVRGGTITATGFQIVNDEQTSSAFWIAIGK